MFDQIDGVAMGSPLAPVLANLFLGHYENIRLKQYNGPSVISTGVTLMTHSVLSTVKMRKKKPIGCLSFLDVCIDNNDPSCLETSVYRKKTFIGLLTNFFSFISFSYKVGLIRTLVIELTQLIMLFFHSIMIFISFSF